VTTKAERKNTTLFFACECPFIRSSPTDPYTVGDVGDLALGERDRANSTLNHVYLREKYFSDQSVLKIFG
jgi:hypothetical protein